MKITVLGSTGFVGKNLIEGLQKEFNVSKTSRDKNKDDSTYFDLFDSPSWKNVIDLQPDIIVNAVGYGVIKHELDLETMYRTNYLLVSEFFSYLQENNCNPFWFQLGTAFEYDLSMVGGITEQSLCLPRTHYGISKLMFTNFLLQRGGKNNFCVVRPFGMFGKYEDESKFFPLLIKSQYDKKVINLSAGHQRRDYVFVGDLVVFIRDLLLSEKYKKLPQVINFGAGVSRSLREYADLLGECIAGFDHSIWKWGSVDYRANESLEFYNSSKLAIELGYSPSRLQIGYSQTVDYYCANLK